MTEETKKRYVAFIRSSEPGMASIHYEVDLGENEGGITVDDILKITKGAKLGQWGGDISRGEIQIRPILSLEEFAEYCDGQRSEHEKMQQEYLKKEKQRVLRERRVTEKMKLKQKEREERNKRRAKAREGKDLVYEVYEKIGEKYEYRETFYNSDEGLAFIKTKENFVLKPWVAPRIKTR